MPIKAIYTQELPNGEVLFGLAPSDVDKIRAGYGCPRCLEDFTDGRSGGRLIVPYSKCPTCGHRLDVERDLVATPEHWRPDPDDPFPYQ